MTEREALASRMGAVMGAALKARRNERAAIVAWLREQAFCGCGRDDCREDGPPLAYADAIERGVHLSKPEHD